MGLHPIIDVPGDIVAFYSGYHISCSSRSNNYMDKRVTSVEQFFYRNMYTVALGVDNLCIDLHPEIGKDVTKYNATLGHKANHSFQPNTELHLFSFHPVLGTTNILVAVADILAGTEVTVDYGYHNNPHQPAWYLEQREEYLAEKEAEIIKRLPWLGGA